MQKIVNQFKYAECEKSKVFFYRFDLRYPEEMQADPDNDHFKHFMSAYIKNLSRKGLDPQYVAVREQKSSENQHYHVGILADGQRTRNCHDHLIKAERLWEHELGLEADGTHGLVDFCEKEKKTGKKIENGMMMDHCKENYETVKAECIRRASYLAKVNQKELTPKGQHEYFTSKMPKGYTNND